MGLSLEDVTLVRSGQREAKGTLNDSTKSPEDEGLGFISFQSPITERHGSEPESGSTDILLLTWLLLLYRYSAGTDVQFSWGYNVVQDGRTTQRPRLSGTSEDLFQDKRVTISQLLDRVHVLRANSICHTDLVQEDWDNMFFNDAFGQDGTETTANWTLQIDIKIFDGSVWLKPSWKGPTMTERLAKHQTQTYVQILNCILNDQSQAIAQILGLIEHERAEIWSWNRDVPPTIDRCMQDLISERARTIPDAPAVCSWDGAFTYDEVEQLSTRLAHRLVQLGISVGSMIPLCFEKSRWTVIALLATMKAGAAFVLMDPSQPEARLKIVAQEVRAKLILTSKAQQELGTRIAPQAISIVVGNDSFQKGEGLVHWQLPSVPASATLYVIFTSGSTGSPKGVVVSHNNYTSGAIPRAQAVGYNSTSRVLDFASYAFDVSIDCMLCTLLEGGCICVPSNDQRVNDLSGAIRSMSVNMAHMTPSVARVLEPDIMPSLQVLGLGGESVGAAEASLWNQQTKIIIAYGPSECTVGCTINNDVGNGRPYTSIGKGVGGVCWIVDPDDHNCLLPPGAVGELLVEGPLVGIGYLNDQEKTSAVFIEDLDWLLSGTRGVAGRRGRLYKTGDLVRYDSDGSGNIIFVGRKDTQVKLRGQRVELGEIEYNLRSSFPQGTRVAAEVIVPAVKGGQPTLVAFVQLPNKLRLQQKDGKDNLRMTEIDAELEKTFHGLSKTLAEALPIYMIPTAYIPLAEMPMMVSGKTDRKRLRAFASNLSLQELSDLRAAGDGRNEKQIARTESELRLQDIWFCVLGIKETIRANDNFFSLGGDSLTAMKLVAAARSEGFTLSVADIFSHPTLSNMASIMASAAGVDHELLVPPFSLLEDGWDIQSARAEAASLCSIGTSAVEDIYPCTALQEGLMALSAKFTEAYVAQRVMDLADLEAVERSKKAFEATVADCSILRTRIVQIAGRGLMQVVVQDGATWSESSNLDEYLAQDKTAPMELGSPLARYGIVKDDTGNKTQLIWTLHHALYDGWSMPLVLDRLNRAYHGLTPPHPSQFKHFIKYLRGLDQEAAKSFWREELRDAVGPQFPPHPSHEYITRADSLLERHVQSGKHTGSRATVATIIRAAWAFVASQLTGSDDVVFGETLTGRTAPLPGIEGIEGPMIATVPVRIRVNRDISVNDYLHTIQTQTAARIPYEHFGLQHIRRVSLDALEACELKTGIVIQPSSQSGEGILQEPGSRLAPADDIEAAREALKFNSYGLMLVCTLDPNGFFIMASFDSNCVEVKQMERVLAQLDFVVQQLFAANSITVGEIDCLSQDEQREIWSWNACPPASIEENTSTLMLNGACKVGAHYPPIVVPWLVDPEDHEHLMPIGAVAELLVEGPLSSSNFIEDPKWLVAGDGEKPGRSGRLFRTGDLVKYSTDGSIVFLARKDDHNLRQDVQGDLQNSDQRAFAGPKPARSNENKSPGTANERHLQQLWAQTLSVDASTIGRDDSFFGLGGDSIMAMKLVSAARLAGLKLSVANIFRHRRLSEMAETIQEFPATKPVSKTYVPFSALDVVDRDTFLSNVVHPALADPTWMVKDVLPATFDQRGAIKATVEVPRFSVQYNLLYFDSPVDKNRLFESCQKLISCHEILQTVYIRHNDRYMSVVLDDLPAPFKEYASADDLETFSKDVCARDADTDIPLGSNFVKFIFVKGRHEQSCLIFRISHAQYDGLCLPSLLLRLGELYGGEEIPRSPPFSAYVYHMINETVPASLPYWRELLQGSKMTVLTPNPPIAKSAVACSVARWISIAGRSKETTIGSLLTAAWAVVLARFLSIKDVTFGKLVAARSADIPDCDKIMGMCDQKIPVRIKFEPGWTGRDIVRCVQEQHISSAPFESVDIAEIIKNCVDWPTDTYFDSIVHHHDIQYSDTMQFGETSCRLDTTNPHVEPAGEWKVESYSKGDQLCLQIVCNEPWEDMAVARLDDLADAIARLIQSPDAIML